MPSLAFAVGVYLPISSTAPIFIGGLIRYFIDKRARKEPAAAALSETEFTAQTDRGPGVLFASGYIAGGAIAGILIAFLAGVLGNFDASLQRWSTANNPFYAGPYADLLAMLPFLLLVLLLWIVASGKWLSGGKAEETAATPVAALVGALLDRGPSWSSGPAGPASPPTRQT